MIDIDYPDVEQIANTDDFVRIANESIGQSANVNQTAVDDPDVDERSEVDNVQHGAAELHARSEVLQLQDFATEEWWWEVFARVASWSDERLEDISQQQRADFKLLSQLIDVDLGDAGHEFLHELGVETASGGRGGDRRCFTSVR